MKIRTFVGAAIFIVTLFAFSDINAKNDLNFCNFVEKSCLTGSWVSSAPTTGYKPVVMKISPFRTSWE